MQRILGIATAMALISGAAYAQYTGPIEKNTTTQAGYTAATVKAILADPKDDQKVLLEGLLVKKLGDEKYHFSDGTGEITVEIDDKDFPKTPVSAETKVRIEGEVDRHLLRETDIDADQVTVIK